MHTSPVAAKILAEKGIDPKEVNGTGAGGRITKEDALNAQKAEAKAPAAAAPKVRQPAPKSAASTPEGETRNSAGRKCPPSGRPLPGDW